jgi:hypothetical protein
VKELAQQQLAELEARQKELDEMRATLSHLVSLCRGDDDPHCAILEQLSASASAETALQRPAGKKNLKQVRAGSTAPASGNCHPPAPEAPGHAALAAWSRGLRS